MLKVLPPPVVVRQFSVPDPLAVVMVMGMLDPELVRVAVPLTLQFVVSGAEGQLPDPDSVALVSVALPLFVVVKVMGVPETVLVVPPQVSMKVRSIS